MPDHDSRAIANWFIKTAHSDGGRHFSPMQIQKLVYIAHGWNLALNDGQPLIRDSVQAWDFGPVIPSLYHSLKRYGAGTVTQQIDVADGDFLDPGESNPIHADLSAPEEEILNQVYESYGHISGSMLSRLTHAQDTPWQKTYQPNVRHNEIDNKLIADHFNDLAKAAGETR